jgi:APA family basic amino acid/polyamine antiporter
VLLVTAAFACVYALIPAGLGLIIGLCVTGGVVLILCIIIHVTCHQHSRPKYRVPFFPYLPAASLLLNCFLMASLPGQAYIQLGIFFAVVTAFYLLYSIHAGSLFEKSENRGALPQKATSGRGVAGSAIKKSSILFAFSPPSHLSPMQGRWAGGVVNLPDEE